MSVYIKGLHKPENCEWLDKDQERLRRCPMLNGEDDCVLQDKIFGTWEDQMMGCPLVEVADIEK